MGRTSTISLSALAFAASSVFSSALPQNNVVKALPVGDVGAKGQFTLPAVKINATGFTVRPRHKSTTDVGSDWYIQAWIGTPGKPFYFLGDSGAPNLSIESTLEPLSQQGNIPKYDPTQSSTAQRVPGLTYSECFGSGYCDNGVVYRDVFVVGQIGLANMHIMVQTNNNSPSNGIRSGNLGLNFDKKGMTTSPNRLPTYFETIIPFLDAPLWTVDWHVSTQKGQFQFGYIDPSKYVGEIAYGPVVDTGGEWIIEVQGVQAGYDDANLNKVKFRLMLDTGSGGGKIPRGIADLYWRGVPNSRWDDGWNNYLYPCGQTLPDFVMQLADGKKVGIPDAGLRWKGENGWCATILGIGGTSTDFMWGQAMIEKYFVVFDWGNSRVGMAKKSSQ
ncbi:aspergillopepsin I [Staphylotrichum tortipilum]|uniref:Aspergillopepsin I n=1 Tax=Staphylotrichum tortipilum TaxID=2831512 RepID=A0AAN6MAB5_9PEZI|nr:aspergillopepsin I [Staphylotrichum longicolle]